MLVVMQLLISGHQLIEHFSFLETTRITNPEVLRTICGSKGSYPFSNTVVIFNLRTLKSVSRVSGCFDQQLKLEYYHSS
jgi:hypothetical protein